MFEEHCCQLDNMIQLDKSLHQHWNYPRDNSIQEHSCHCKWRMTILSRIHMYQQHMNYIRMTHAQELYQSNTCPCYTACIVETRQDYRIQARMGGTASLCCLEDSSIQQCTSHHTWNRSNQVDFHNSRHHTKSTLKNQSNCKTQQDIDLGMSFHLDNDGQLDTHWHLHECCL